MLQGLKNGFVTAANPEDFGTRLFIGPPKLSDLVNEELMCIGGLVTFSWRTAAQVIDTMGYIREPDRNWEAAGADITSRLHEMRVQSKPFGLAFLKKDLGAYLENCWMTDIHTELDTKHGARWFARGTHTRIRPWSGLLIL